MIEELEDWRVRETQQRDETQRLNRNELLHLMQQYGFVIRAIDFPNWRPTQRSSGTIPGVWDNVEIIATDGLLGYFVEGQDVLIGHIQMFTGDVKPLFSTPKNGAVKPRKPKQKSKRQQILNSI
jgi:hypothetical protein